MADTSAADDTLGEEIVLVGRVLDEDGRPVRGALIDARAGSGCATARVAP